MGYQKFSFVVGFSIWLLATIVFRTAGQYFFLTDRPVVGIILYIAVVPLLGFIANYVFNKYQLTKPQAIHSAVIMVLPGMVLDAFCTEFFAHVFPNMPENRAASFGAWLMWAYASVLVFGLTRKNN